MIKLISSILVCTFLFGCTHGDRSESTPAMEIHNELLDDFVSTVCDQQTPDSFIEAWDQHEKSNWEFYSSVYYGGKADLSERDSLKLDMKDRRVEICKNARAFRSIGRQVVLMAARDVAQLTGFEPQVPIYFSAAIQQTDGNSAEYKGQRIYVLNGRHDTYARTPGMVATITHELIHGSFARRFAVRETGLKPIQNGLYWEGAAVFGVTTLYPEIGDGATGINKEDLKLVPQFEKRIAKEILSHWDKPNVGQKIRERFFSGRKPADGSPRKMGYYFGLRIFQRLAKVHGLRGALSAEPTQFENVSRQYLTEVAGEQ